MKVKMKASPPELSPQFEKRISALANELSCIDETDESVRLSVLRLAFKRASKVKFTKDRANSSTLVKQVKKMKVTRTWARFQTKYVDQALAEHEKDIDRRLQEAFRNLLPTHLQDAFDDVCHGDFLYMMPKMKTSASRPVVRLAVQLALQRVLNYSRSKLRAYVKDYVIPRLSKMNKYDFAAEQRGDPEQSHMVTGQLRLGKKGRDVLNSTIRKEITRLTKAGLTRDKAYADLAKRSRSFLKYKLSPNQIAGRYRRPDPLPQHREGSSSERITVANIKYTEKHFKQVDRLLHKGARKRDAFEKVFERNFNGDSNYSLESFKKQYRLRHESLTRLDQGLYQKVDVLTQSGSPLGSAIANVCRQKYGTEGNKMKLMQFKRGYKEHRRRNRP
jgi:hypothetical protein